VAAGSSPTWRSISVDHVVGDRGALHRVLVPLPRAVVQVAPHPLLPVELQEKLPEEEGVTVGLAIERVDERLHPQRLRRPGRA